MNIPKTEPNKPETASLHFSEKVLTCNVLYNIAGRILPIGVSFFCIPYLIHGLGTEKFGVLTLAWMVVGYFNLFNLGVGRATTKFVAEYIGRNETQALPPLIWNSIIILLGFGVITGLIIVVLTPWLVTDVLKIPKNLIDETLTSFHLLALSVPFVLGSAGGRGVLEAQQRFGLVNVIRVPASISNFLMPLLVMVFLTNSLSRIVVGLVITRFMIFLIYLYFCLNSFPGLKKPQPLNVFYVKKLLGFGGWLTLSNIVGPFMSYMDRFILGSILTISAVAYYATMYDLVKKLRIISSSLMGVVFPAFSAYSVRHVDKFILLYERSVKYLLITLTPIVLILVVMAKPFLNFWLGQEFAMKSTIVLQILSIGIFINAFSRVPYATIQALGRPDITAKLHVFELILHLVMMWLLIPSIGIIGAALAFALRVVIDTILLFVISFHIMPTSNNVQPKFIQPIILALSVLGISFYFTTVVSALLLKFLMLFIFIGGLTLYSWKCLLDNKEKKKIAMLFFRLYEYSNKIIGSKTFDTGDWNE